MALTSNGPAPAGNSRRTVFDGVPLDLRVPHSLRPQNLSVLRLWSRDA